MTIQSMMTAAAPFNELLKKHFKTIKMVYDLAMLKKVLDEKLNWGYEKEKEYIEQYALKDAKGSPKITEDGRVVCKSLEERNEFEVKLKELHEMDIPEIKPVELSENDFRSSDDLPTPEDLIKLQGVVNFKL